MTKIIKEFKIKNWELFKDKISEPMYCQGTFERTEIILEEMDYNKKEIGQICKFFQTKGGYCDCEVMLNVFFPFDESEME